MGMQSLLKHRMTWYNVLAQRMARTEGKMDFFGHFGCCAKFTKPLGICACLNCHEGKTGWCCEKGMRVLLADMMRLEKKEKRGALTFT